MKIHYFTGDQADLIVKEYIPLTYQDGFCGVMRTLPEYCDNTNAEVVAFEDDSGMAFLFQIGYLGNFCNFSLRSDLRKQGIGKKLFDIARSMVKYKTIETVHTPYVNNETVKQASEHAYLAYTLTLVVTSQRFNREISCIKDKNQKFFSDNMSFHTIENPKYDSFCI